MLTSSKVKSELESLVKPCQVHLLKLQQSKGHYKAEDIVKSSREDLPARGAEEVCLSFPEAGGQGEARQLKWRVILIILLQYYLWIF